ncbi:hypothetical protein RA307_02580 [Xanthobacteraceae bacterium Astr-EGSB]|uniref:ribbon-helix-helix domain-containing protein n=1 Tax=Astrobacterium formosum TaxID=3069710 RepID=UPI0027B501B5|nr:hypothetical protein [Xanthobacteraceae bacterium Astr-EGSB]
MTKRRKLADSLEASSNVFNTTDSLGDQLGEPDERCGVLVRVTPAVRDELKLLAIQNRTKMQALMVEAINDLFAKNNRPPIA